MSIKISVCAFFIILATWPLAAILDGTNQAIYLTTHYTFTQGEWAKGFVTFLNGFDIPTNGTVYLDIHPPIQGQINFNNGTLVMKSDLNFGPLIGLSGNGYIKSNNYSINYTGEFRPFGKIYFTDDVIFNGNNGGLLTISLPAEFHLEKVQNVTLKNTKVFANAPVYRWFPPAGGFVSLLFDNIDFEIFSGGAIDIKATNFSIKNHCIFRGAGSGFRTTSPLTISTNARLEIGFDTTAQFSSLTLESLNSELILNNQSKLNFYGSTSWLGLGHLLVNGEASLSTNNLTITTNSGGVHLAQGSRLKLIKTKLKIS